MGLPNPKSQYHVRAYRQSEADKRERALEERVAAQVKAVFALQMVLRDFDAVKENQYRRLEQQLIRKYAFVLEGYQSLYSAVGQASVDFLNITKKEVESGLQEAIFNTFFGIATIVAPELAFFAAAGKIARTAKTAKFAQEVALLAKGTPAAAATLEKWEEAAKTAKEAQEGVAKAQEAMRTGIESSKAASELRSNLKKLSDGIADEDPAVAEAWNMTAVRRVFDTLDDLRDFAFGQLNYASVLLSQPGWFATSGAIQALIDGIQTPGETLTGQSTFRTALYADVFLYDLLKEYTRRHVLVQWGQPIVSIGPTPAWASIDVVPPSMVEVIGMDGREMAYERLGRKGTHQAKLMRSGRPPVDSFRDLVKVWGATYQRKKWFW